MPHDLIQGQGQGHETLKLGNSSVFKVYLLRIYCGSWQMTADP